MIRTNYTSDESYFGAIITTLGNEIGKDGKASDLELLGKSIPDVLPILPVRGIVVYPLTAVPLTVGQPRSVSLIDAVTKDDPIIGLVTSNNPDLETPGPDQLYRIGTAAAVHRLMKTPDGTIRLLVQGIARIRIGDYVDTDPYLKAQVELEPEARETGIKIEALVRTRIVGES